MWIWALGIVLLLISCKGCQDPVLVQGSTVHWSQFRSVVEWQQSEHFRKYRAVTKCGRTVFLIIDNEGKLQESW